MASAMRGVSFSLIPRNVEQITKEAQDYDYDQQVPLRYWLRSATTMAKQAEVYAQENDNETEYLLRFRHAHLILAHLATHPDAKDPVFKVQLNQAKKEVDQNLKILDILRPKINQHHERYICHLREREARRQLQVQNGLPITDDSRHADEYKSNTYQAIDGQLHPDIAVKLARQEFNRRADGRVGAQTSRHSYRLEADDLSQSIQTVRSRLAANNQISDPTRLQSTFGEHDDQTEYRYPQVRVPNPQQELVVRAKTSASQPLLTIHPPAVPSRPEARIHTQVPAVPARPAKVEALVNLHVHDSEPKYTFKSTASLENGAPLRTVFLPPTLRTTFLRLAYKNTVANLETCGFLAGSLVSNALFVSKLIVPAQVATSDTCEMTNESQLFDYVDSQNNLMVLGWIHTHPTQTCFMSSRDLHTHAGYQMMLAESIAIVCAPSKGDTSHGGDWGAFRLTDPPGKMAILNCSKPGLFHPHDVDNVYTDALRPGHVVEAKGLEFEIVDLR